jgi:hypothetical protein
MFVTAFYPIHSDTSFQFYFDLFYDIGMSGIPIIVFTDSSYMSYFNVFPSSVTVIYIPIESFELYRIAMNYKGTLPSGANPQKDTQKYLALMNTKIEFIWYAVHFCPNYTTYTWIDFGILKIIQDRTTFINKLKTIESSTFQKITIPGCWEYGRPFNVDTIHWRFCGGIIIIPKEYVDRFYQHSKNVLIDFCTSSMYKLTWEVNIWTVIEFCAEKDSIQWYSADHNDSIVFG